MFAESQPTDEPPNSPGHAGLFRTSATATALMMCTMRDIVLSPNYCRGFSSFHDEIPPTALVNFKFRLNRAELNANRILNNNKERLPPGAVALKNGG